MSYPAVAVNPKTNEAKFSEEFMTATSLLVELGESSKYIVSDYSMDEIQEFLQLISPQILNETVDFLFYSIFDTETPRLEIADYLQQNYNIAPNFERLLDRITRSDTELEYISKSGIINKLDPSGENYFTRMADLLIQEHYVEDAKKMISHGADINMKNKKGKTALDVALSKRLLVSIEALLHLGAKRSVPFPQEKFFDPIVNAYIEKLEPG